MGTPFVLALPATDEAKYPARHWVQLAEFGGAEEPGAQRVHVALEVAPTAAEDVPAGQPVQLAVASPGFEMGP